MAQQQHSVQTSLEDLGTPLSATTFVVVDLETTGARSSGAGITEIGAVKVRGGEVLGEFGTLVNPGVPIPPFITLLTGITQAMVATAPPVDAVLPGFLEFAELDRGAVLVAHNAPFDVGFLKAVCADHGLPWPAPTVVDTVPLARRLIPRGEVGNHKLATLAGFLGVPDRPTHRALDDARATVGVLHGLLERLGAFGVDTLEELRAFRSAPTSVQRGKRHLADDLPESPGVYVFEDARGDALYIGKSGNLRRRVRSYFTAAETRRRIREMVGLAERVRPIVCATPLEAEVRELRLICERHPPYNRRSRHQERLVWLKLTREPYPRLSVVRDLAEDGAPYLGPFRSAREAQLAREALEETAPIRRCNHRLRRSPTVAACALAGMGRCGAPCEGRESVDDYAAHVAAVTAAMTDEPGRVVTRLRQRIEELSRELRYEEAAAHRDRLAAFLRASIRRQRLAALAGCSHLVAGRPTPAGWELAVIRHGRLAGSALMGRGERPAPFLSALVATAETVEPGPGPAPRATPEEMECLLRWLESPGLRLAEIEGTWSCPVDGAEKYRDLTDWGHGRHPAQ
ncbi:DEDD exonuclease domain-containing protein [Marinactinospora thermotolerans]|uniref:DNA polymerase-3 subunit epsilon n=1 Tax=Marinactinospora thermotolerans DSM 45154 TaxID=1122192 RepID=A0A1T4ME59_9ACTN|nr:DEDD exonuclease domain-containing protein [Marinactinospora thermotolerans]SJZ65360.1 DNA polymerase-3 subunit epsilon [Marinactinospora thermotolerans DSM 45154]